MGELVPELQPGLLAADPVMRVRMQHIRGIQRCYADLRFWRLTEQFKSRNTVFKPVIIVVKQQASCYNT